MAFALMAVPATPTPNAAFFIIEFLSRMHLPYLRTSSWNTFNSASVVIATASVTGQTDAPASANLRTYSAADTNRCRIAGRRHIT
jgi:hypothetical protein